jgi:hypothetical protein
LIDNEHAPQAEVPIGYGDPHDEIARLESDIEKLAEAMERCRKLILISKAATVLGTMMLLATALGIIGFDLATVMGAFAAVFGGAVVFGSNTSTSKQIAGDVKVAERLRSELISQIDLHLVGEPHSRIAAPR